MDLGYGRTNSLCSGVVGEVDVLDVGFVVVVSSGAGCIERAVDLVVAECADGSFGFVEVVARWVEVETEELDQAGELALRIGDEAFVVDIEDRDVERGLPVVHHAVGEGPCV